MQYPGIQLFTTLAVAALYFGGCANEPPKPLAPPSREESIKEIAENIGMAFSACHKAITSGWQDSLDGFISSSWSDIEMRLPATSPTTVAGATIVAHSTTDGFVEYFLIPDVLEYMFTVAGSTRNAELARVFMVKVEISSFSPPDDPAVTEFVRDFSCSLDEGPSMSLGYTPTSFSEWTLSLKAISDSTTFSLRFKSAGLPKSVQACRASECIEQEITPENLDSLKSIALGGKFAAGFDLREIESGKLIEDFFLTDQMAEMLRGIQ